MGAHEHVTALLERWSRGDRDALEQLIPIVYDELRKLAASYLRHEDPSPTLETTALVHEVYLRLVDQQRAEFHNRAHFYGAAAQIMRRILVDRARERKADKRGGAGERLSLEDALATQLPADVDLVELDRALDGLEEFDAGKARLVELRYFAGLSIPQTAEMMGVSPTTVKFRFIAVSFLSRICKGMPAIRGRAWPSLPARELALVPA